MESFVENKNTNMFFTRGCKSIPRPYQDNSNIYCDSCSKLCNFDWLKNIKLPPKYYLLQNIVEVRFKNNRKEFFREPRNTKLNKGEIVVVETTSGHDIGIVSMPSGIIINLQLKRKGIDSNSKDIKKIYRRAKATDIEQWIEAVEQEKSAIKRTKQITDELDIEMKLDDVEFQGDGTKAIFYYTAEERIDFRKLIKILAEEFNVRVEMHQIGARQESAKLGGLGVCGRETCCSSWIYHFKSVSTVSVRTQQLSLNPQKLAGQCGKLKCCLNYEQDCYLDALKEFPDTSIVLVFKNKKASHQKTDIFKKIMWYSYFDDENNLMAIPLDKVLQIIDMNNHRVFPDKLEDFALAKEEKNEFENVVGQDELTRFDD